ncbi:hypothetical protein HPULCUR_011642 [Helicostylum pulchrum]|uniref:SET domain-containing protein 2 n=1 Tax=Helicostylum pulchrum TaxID=562976 RepID=A0ABP9YGM3_9FUNG
MHKTNIRSSAVSLEIREKKYIIKHVNSVLDTKQFAKKAHAISSSTVNVVCAKVTTTTTTTSQEMWNRMNNERQRSIDSFDRTFPQDTTTSQDEQEDHESDLDIINDSSSQQSDFEQEELVEKRYDTAPNLFEFHFEFGSKRPPRTTFIPSEDEQEQDSDRDQDDDSASNDEQEWEKEDVMENTKQFPSATDEALQVYENIAANIYIGSATGRSMAEESMPCECKYDSELDNPSEACGDDNICINRMMFMECIVQDCPCGRLCQNRRFQLSQYAPVDVIKTEKKGFGLRALTDLPSNCFIMEYIGEVIPQTEFIRRTREYDAEGFKHYYFMTLKNDEIIDATKRGCLARFMNHSCNPNCVTQKWVIGKKMRIGIFTSRTIKAGEELTFDYKFERYGAIAQKCYCGEPNCKGYIGASDEKLIDEEVLTDTHMNSSSGSSSEDDYDEDEDDEDEDLDIITLRRPQPLQDPEKVRSFVKRMLNSVGKPRLVNKLLMRLKMTNVDNSHGREILKMIVRLHGLKMLKFWLGEWKNNETIVLKALQVLEKLPLANRNGLEDCKLFDVVHKFIDHENEEICRLSQYLLEEWSDLKCVYRIPKRAHVELIRPLIASDDDDDIVVDGDDDEEVEVEELPSVDIMVKKITRPTNNKKKKKRLRYESSREFFDPDNDYFEYLTLDTTLEELSWKLIYPPQTLIPTAPKAMLDTTTSTTTTVYQPSHYHHQKQYYNKHKKHTSTAAGAYFSYSTVNNNSISSFNSSSTPSISSSTPVSTPAINNSNLITNNNTQTDSIQQQQQQQQQQFYTDYYQDPSFYDYSQFYYTAAANAAAESMTVEEYYYAFQHQHQQQQPVTQLPLNWQMAITEDGSTYYYNIATHQTQWELPVEDQQQQHISIDSDPLQLEELVEQSVHNSGENKKRLLLLQNNVDSPINSKDENHHLLTPTSGSVDVEDAGPFLNDIDLKREVGKVVTKYLSAKQQTLWKGDKHLFKDLARKVTHHIVDRETRSGRKIKSMETPLRIKIEKFIDVHGTEYVSKSMKKN